MKLFRLMRLALALALLAWAAFAVGAAVTKAQETAGPLVARHTSDLDEMKKRRLVRIIVPYSKSIYFVDKGQQLGTAVEFGTELEKTLNAGRKKEIERIRVAFLPLARDELLTALNDGIGDIVIANLTVTDQRRELVDFTAPIYSDASEVLVTGPSEPEVASLDDLSGKELRVRQSSSYNEHLIQFNKQLTEAGKQPISVMAIDEDLEDEDILEMVNAGLLPWTVVDRHKAELWTKVFDDLVMREDIVISSGGQIAWAIRKNSPQLKAELNKFVASHKVGTTFGNILRNRYYRSDKMLKRAYSAEDVERYKDLIELFRKHGTTYSFDHLMLIAQGYQESQLDQNRRSPRGAVGIMQLLPNTAADQAVAIKGIDKDADRNIEAGSKYLRYLVGRYLADPDITPRDQMLMGFAAYNAGPANLRKFRAKATELGLDRNVWFGNVENGAAAIVGRETVQYVSNIFKYYVAYTLLSERLHEHATAVETGTAN
ncbi:lytic transglycosylase F [Rhizobiaceae bacterium n13]|uniref:Lytic transglycosylase F n=1 Tax=Ferirhizobium litorale TaxID=2927786 RepID=A0AAE3U171_9HYPH|nr:lytic transglycosylase F [Fererhizobium litorale]MDI7861627.1 lytic transglycosylase F [Fererhizobium litorale]MDI7922031.1 lytic transglycosylase F [Fererhizobium litorale]